jgi:hypothetical protein
MRTAVLDSTEKGNSGRSREEQGEDVIAVKFVFLTTWFLFWFYLVTIVRCVTE